MANTCPVPACFYRSQPRHPLIAPGHYGRHYHVARTYKASAVRGDRTSISKFPPSETEGMGANLVFSLEPPCVPGPNFLAQTERTPFNHR